MLFRSLFRWLSSSHDSWLCQSKGTAPLSSAQASSSAMMRSTRVMRSQRSERLVFFRGQSRRVGVVRKPTHPPNHNGIGACDCVVLFSTRLAETSRSAKTRARRSGVPRLLSWFIIELHDESLTLLSWFIVVMHYESLTLQLTSLAASCKSEMTPTTTL